MRGIALNARFRVHRVTGMQRYAIEISKRIEPILDSVEPPHRLRGPAGHLWEQFYLPLALRGRLLWSPNLSFVACHFHQEKWRQINAG